MQTTPILRMLLGSLVLALLAPAAVAAPGVTVNADANNTVVCYIHPVGLGPYVYDLTLQVYEDCSASASADTHTVVAICHETSTGDVFPGIHDLAVTLERDCTLTVDVSV